MESLRTILVTFKNEKILAFWHLGKDRSRNYTGEIFHKLFFAWSWLVLKKRTEAISSAKYFLYHMEGVSTNKKGMSFEILPTLKKKLPFFFFFFENTTGADWLENWFFYYLAFNFFLQLLNLKWSLFWICPDLSHCGGLAIIFSVYFTQIDGGVWCLQDDFGQTSSWKRANDTPVCSEEAKLPLLLIEEEVGVLLRT